MKKFHGVIYKSSPICGKLWYITGKSVSLLTRQSSEVRSKSAWLYRYSASRIGLKNTCRRFGQEHYFLIKRGKKKSLESILNWQGEVCEWPKTDRHWLKAIEVIPEVIRSLDKKVMKQDKWPFLIRTLPAYFSDLFHSPGTVFLLNTSRKKKLWLEHWAGVQSIWIQCLALLQISNMTLGTSINLLRLRSLAVKWKESYCFFLARLLVFSAEPLSVFGGESFLA